MILPKRGKFDQLFYDLVWLLAGATLDVACAKSDHWEDEAGSGGTVLAGATLDAACRRSDEWEDAAGSGGTVVGIIASCRKLGGERIEVWVVGASEREEPGREFCRKLKDALARELGLPEVCGPRPLIIWF